MSTSSSQQPQQRKSKGSASGGDVTKSIAQSKIDAHNLNLARGGISSEQVQQQQHPLLLLPSSPPLFLPLLSFLLVLLTYLSTAYPSISGGDAGELAVSVCNSGVAHPPGYPTFTMLGTGWLWLTDQLGMSGNQRGERINQMSCIFGAIAAAGIAWSTAALAAGKRKNTSTPITSHSSSTTISYPSLFLGLLSSLGFSFSSTTWLYSLQAEVFALNNMLVAGLIVLTVVYFRKEERVEMGKKEVDERKKTDVIAATNATPSSSSSSSSSSSPSTLLPLAYLGSFLCGLCLTNQHTTVFPVIVTSAFVTFSLWKHGMLSIKRVFYLITFVLLGMTPYLYIVLRAHTRVVDSWGDQRTLRGFLLHLLRQEYGTFQLASTELSEGDPGMWERLLVYVQNMKEEMGGVIPYLAVIGVITTLILPSSRTPSSTRRTSLVLLLSYLFYTLVFHKLANLDLRPLFLGVQARFWMQSNVVVWIFAGVGGKKVMEGVAWIVCMIVKKNNLKYSITLLLTASYTLAFLFTHFLTNYPLHNHSTDISFYTQGVRTLQSFPPQSLVLLNGDLNTNMLKYPQSCEGVRTKDLTLLSLQLMSWEWFVPMQRSHYSQVIFPGIRYHISSPRSFTIKKFLDANQSTRNKNLTGGVFLCGTWKEGDRSIVRSTSPSETKYYEEFPYGLCSQLLPYGTKPQNLTSFLTASYDSLTPYTELPPFEAWKYGEDSWERVLYRDIAIRVAYITSYISFSYNQDTGNIPLLKLAVRATEEMRKHSELFQYFELIKPYEYRSAGVIYGFYSKHLESLGTNEAKKEAQQWSRRLYYAWYSYLLLNKGQDKEILPSILDKMNPYTGKKIVGLEQEEEFKKLKPLH